MKAIILGSHNFIGAQILQECVQSNVFKKIIAIDSEASPIRHQNVIQICSGGKMNFKMFQQEFRDADICFYCLGAPAHITHWPFKGFHEKNLGYLKKLMAVLNGLNTQMSFCFFSTQETNIKEITLNPAAPVRNAAENIVRNSRVRSQYIFRPGYIIQDRSNKPINPLFWPYHIFQGINAQLFSDPSLNISQVAKAMLAAPLHEEPSRIFEKKDIQSMAKKTLPPVAEAFEQAS